MWPTFGIIACNHYYMTTSTRIAGLSSDVTLWRCGRQWIAASVWDWSKFL